MMMVGILMVVDESRGEIVHPHVSRVVIFGGLMLLGILRMERHGIVLDEEEEKNRRLFEAIELTMLERTLKSHEEGGGGNGE